jgi:N-acetylmuramoyl-L-alanine amidase
MNSAAYDGTLRTCKSLCPTVVLLIIAASVALIASPTDEKRISVYAVVANYSLPVSEHSGKDYVGLLELLEPLGSVSAKANGNRWKLLYNDADCEFTTGNRRVQIRGKNFDLAANFLLENGRGLVPLASLSTLLPQILGGPVTFNETARRLLVGNVAVHFTAQVIKTTPPKLVLNFTSPVNPTIATEPGKMHMAFTREAVVAPGSQVLTFDSSIIPSASFQENNGSAELVVNSSAPLLASFSSDRRTITLAPPAAPSPASATVPGGTPSPATTATAPAAPPATTAATPPAPVPPPASHYFAVVDAAHGGDERGAALTDKLAEKDITLALARSLRQELTARGLATMLVRDADITLTADQRASANNGAAPVIYICVHASSEGRGVRLYTASLPAGAENRGPFLDWNTAQESFRPASQAAEDAVAEALKRKEIPVRSLTAALRPLNSIAGAALAIEVAPSASDVSQLNSSVYQQIIASTVAAGIADARDKLKVEQK